MTTYITPEEYEVAEANGIPQKLVDSRVRKYGWSKDRAITQSKREFNSDKAYVDIAKDNGISYSTYKSRVFNGWSEEDAANTPVLNRRNAGIASRAKDRVYDEGCLKLAKKNGIAYHTFRSRVLYLGWDEQTAATKRSRRRRA